MQILNVNGASSGIVKQVQRGDYTFLEADGSITINIEKTDFSKAIILLNGIGFYQVYNSQDLIVAETYMIYAVTDNSFSVRRCGNITGGFCSFSWQVIEFN